MINQLMINGKEIINASIIGVKICRELITSVRFVSRKEHNNMSSLFTFPVILPSGFALMFPRVLVVFNTRERSPSLTY